MYIVRRTGWDSPTRRCAEPSVEPPRPRRIVNDDMDLRITRAGGGLVVAAGRAMSNRPRGGRRRIRASEGGESP